jgi:hypothetical protein
VPLPPVLLLLLPRPEGVPLCVLEKPGDDDPGVIIGVVVVFEVAEESAGPGAVAADGPLEDDISLSLSFPIEKGPSYYSTTWLASYCRLRAQRCKSRDIVQKIRYGCLSRYVFGRLWVISKPVEHAGGGV